MDTPTLPKSDPTHINSTIKFRSLKPKLISTLHPPTHLPPNPVVADHTIFLPSISKQDDFHIQRFQPNPLKSKIIYAISSLCGLIYSPCGDLFAPPKPLYRHGPASRQGSTHNEQNED